MASPWFIHGYISADALLGNTTEFLLGHNVYFWNFKEGRDEIDQPAKSIESKVKRQLFGEINFVNSCRYNA